MSKDWTAYAQHILDATGRIELIRSRGNLLDDVVLYDAALRNLQTLSEATQRLPDDIKSRFPDIPWRQISGFRNILVHNYLGEIDPAAIEGVIERHLPALEAVVREILGDIDPSAR